jgi:hypothetical protein
MSSNPVAVATPSSYSIGKLPGYFVRLTPEAQGNSSYPRLQLWCHSRQRVPIVLVESRARSMLDPMYVVPAPLLQSGGCDVESGMHLVALELLGTYYR